MACATAPPWRSHCSFSGKLVERGFESSDSYADTGDRRWLVLTGKFHHVAIVDRSAEMKDILPGIQIAMADPRQSGFPTTCLSILRTQ
jgi:hypothetical protein